MYEEWNQCSISMQTYWATTSRFSNFLPTFRFRNLQWHTPTLRLFVFGESAARARSNCDKFRQIDILQTQLINQIDNQLNEIKASTSLIHEAITVTQSSETEEHQREKILRLLSEFSQAINNYPQPELDCDEFSLEEAIIHRTNNHATVSSILENIDKELAPARNSQQLLSR